jgi:hypothetical protein
LFPQWMVPLRAWLTSLGTPQGSETTHGEAGQAAVNPRHLPQPAAGYERLTRLAPTLRAWLSWCQR